VGELIKPQKISKVCHKTQEIEGCPHCKRKTEIGPPSPNFCNKNTTRDATWIEYCPAGYRGVREKVTKKYGGECPEPKG